ncbi:MAG TPA: class I SAM-dependent methyltransferase [Saprospiraceae bacterium]|nr:class I SAM-dependent methyltransferase [Saprospiraceae bacterium]
MEIFLGKQVMTEFWEEAFRDKGVMWGYGPAVSTVLVKDFFIRQHVRNILIPGIGYGRNAQIFRDNGISVTGIEISKTAIDLAHRHFGSELTIYHGSVIEMPFDSIQYDGIYCYALIHLLDKDERKDLIQNCFNQLTEGGFMIFATITKEAQIYEQGTCIGVDRFEVFGGVSLFFYDRETIQEEFVRAGLFEIEEVTDIYPFYLIKCKKGVISEL